MKIEGLKMTPVKGLLDSQENGKPAGANGAKSFSEFLGDALNEVNSLEKQSYDAVNNLAAGKIQDLSEVTIAGEKANIALQLTMQIRNKAVEAYQEIMRMQV